MFPYFMSRSKIFSVFTLAGNRLSAVGMFPSDEDHHGCMQWLPCSQTADTAGETWIFAPMAALKWLSGDKRKCLNVCRSWSCCPKVHATQPQSVSKSLIHSMVSAVEEI